MQFNMKYMRENMHKMIQMQEIFLDDSKYAAVLAKTIMVPELGSGTTSTTIYSISYTNTLFKNAIIPASTSSLISL